MQHKGDQALQVWLKALEDLAVSFRGREREREKGERERERERETIMRRGKKE